MNNKESFTPQAKSGKVSWGLLLVLCGAIFLEGIDVSMINVTLPSIRTELGMSTGALSWVVSAYVLGYGGFMLLGGRAADLLGRRRMFLAWLFVFLVFSGLGGFATEGWMLIIARFVTGVAAAFMTPAGLSIITTSFPEGPQRNKALLVYAGTAAAGFSLGLVVGGLLTSVDWRWVFFAPVILAAVILVSAYALIPRTARPERSMHGFDFGGAISVTGAMLLLVSAVVNAPDAAWEVTVGTLALGLAFLAAFVAIERRSAAPLMRLGLLRSGALVRANLGAVLLAGSFFGFQFIAVLYLQELRGWSAFETGLALLAVGVDAILAPTLTPRLVSRFGNVRVILGGLALAAVAYALFLPVSLDWSYAAMFPTMILTGIAFALTYGPLTIAATDGIAEEEQGLASGLVSTSIQFGAALGLSAVTAVSIIATGSDESPQAALEGYRTALLVPVAAAVLGAAITAIGLRKRDGSRAANKATGVHSG
ncbi:MFS transporter [Paenibacillus arenilitoris]|uniref:MFS transporter n=1 Tax=Paenibacillus arenilitoris TaxID=2772299 RepID=A0A927CP59_9BACL|nr:MFS transporter [Paenibacillus arenilitoris]MBD2870975.1 MFS transporter [Paenibacillus arenilitoris]